MHLYLRKLAGEIAAEMGTHNGLVSNPGSLSAGRLKILKTEAKVKFARPIHWNCVRSKQVVFKCSDVTTFHQNLALGKRVKLLMEAQDQVVSKFIQDGTKMDRVLLTVNVLSSRLFY